MKRTLEEILAGASEEALDPLLSEADLSVSLDRESLNRIKKATYQKTGITPVNTASKTQPRRWKAWLLIAACLAVIIITAVSVDFIMGNNIPGTQSTPPQTDDGQTILLDPNGLPQSLSGIPDAYLVRDISLSGTTSIEPPTFAFQPAGICVEAEFEGVLPDIYYELHNWDNVAYRVLRFRVKEVLHGENIPESFYYLIEDYLLVNLSGYDSLILSMSQMGAENYVMRNAVKNEAEAFALPLFSGSPHLGNMIAFTDGVFDETLWQNDNWHFGYQFGKRLLDEEDPENRKMVVHRGCTLEYTKQAIAEDVQAWKDWCAEAGREYKLPTAVSLKFTTEEAKTAMEYVTPFENGVFAQSLSSNDVSFRRYINGSWTEETVEINLNTEQVTYTEAQYTKEDMEGLANVAQHVALLVQAYEREVPVSPRVDPEGKELRSLRVLGWYAKANGKAYGIIATLWWYVEFTEEATTVYYDDCYVLFSPDETLPRTIARDDLAAIVGEKNVRSSSLQRYEPMVFPPMP